MAQSSQPIQREKEDKDLSERMMAHHLASRKTYGVRRIKVDLQAENRHCGKERIAELMKRLGIKAGATDKYKVTTDSKHRLHRAPNLLKLDFSPAKANQVWASDISYISTQTGFLYLATVIDLYSRMIVGWYHTLEVELIYTMKLMTEQQASNAIFDYMESFYNRQRRHSTLAYLPPMDYETAA